MIHDSNLDILSPTFIIFKLRISRVVFLITQLELSFSSPVAHEDIQTEPNSLKSTSILSSLIITAIILP